MVYCSMFIEFPEQFYLVSCTWGSFELVCLEEGDDSKQQNVLIKLYSPKYKNGAEPKLVQVLNLQLLF